MNQTLRKIVLTSVLTALAVVLGIIIKFTPGLNFEFPNGGHVVGLYTLPLILIGMIVGFPYGLIGGLIYGLVSFFLDGYLIHWGSFFFDYIFAFTSIGIAGGIFGGKALKNWRYFVLAFVIAFLLRWVSHGISGGLFFAEYAPDGVNPWFFSFILYNLPYVLSSSVISLVIGLALRPQLMRVLDLKN